MDCPAATPVGTAEAARLGARGPNKELLSQQFTKRKQSLKQLCIVAPEELKAARQRKHHGWKRKRRLL
jgi:hypothetical protein